MKITRRNSSWFSLLPCTVLSLSSCAEAPKIQETINSLQHPPSGDSTDDGSDKSRVIPDPNAAGNSAGGNDTAGNSTGGADTGSGNTTEGGGGIVPCTETNHTETFTPSSIRGANIVFLIDDSGSMKEEIQGVISQVQSFLSKISAATHAGDYRVVLIYDHRESVFSDGGFIDQNGQPINKTLHPNPLDYLIDNQNTFYFQSNTWSKWADIAFLKVFAPANYLQTLPSPIPLDTPSTALVPSGGIFLPLPAANCNGSGKFFRPRFDHGDSNFGYTLPCFDAAAVTLPAFQHRAIANFLLRDITVNFIAISDDDLNVAFDRAHFNYATYDANNPLKNAYPAITYNMLNDLIRPLGTNVPMLYHSIVGIQSSNQIANIGRAHLALSKKTGGATHEVEDFAGYQDAFEQISEKVIFSEQVITLQCAVRAGTTPNVRLNGSSLNADQFTYAVGEKIIRLKPSIFSPNQIDQAVNASVTY